MELDLDDALEDLPTRFGACALALAPSDHAKTKHCSNHQATAGVHRHRVNLTRIGGDCAFAGRPCQSRAGVKRVRNAHATAA